MVRIYENSNIKTNPPLNLTKITDAKEQMKMITRYNEAMAMAQETVLPDRPKRTKEEWYQLSITELQKAQERTRAAFHNYMLKTTQKHIYQQRKHPHDRTAHTVTCILLTSFLLLLLCLQMTFCGIIAMSRPFFTEGLNAPEP